jgi:hypothetical protein
MFYAKYAFLECNTNVCFLGRFVGLIIWLISVRFVGLISELFDNGFR